MSDITVFSYRLTSDTGFAPCVDNGVFTLACCKGGQFRAGKYIKCGLRHRIGAYSKDKSENTEVFLLGIYKDTLLYYARISEVFTMSYYYRSGLSKGRTDNIYSYDQTGYCDLVRNDLLPKVHPKIDPVTNTVNPQIYKDICGEYVLYSTEFSYWGIESTVISDEEILSILPKRQEYYPLKPYSNHLQNFNKIHEFVLKQGGYSLGKLADPHDPISLGNCRGCNQK
jgi:hypothetical protein